MFVTYCISYVHNSRSRTNMIYKDVLLPNVQRIPNGIIVTLQSIIFDSVTKVQQKNASHIPHMCRVQCESLLCNGVPNH
jgi:hypothetical protein